MFKALVGRGHAEFSSARQQDAPEFFLHLLAAIERAERADSGSDSHSLLSLFRYQVWVWTICKNMNKENKQAS